MANRSWFFASEGRQQGPYPEDQFRVLISRGLIRSDTLVWTEGLTNWQKAGDIPGLLSGGSAPPPMPGGSQTAIAGGEPGRAVSIDFGIWDFTWRTLLLVIGILLLIPAPWVIVMYCRWIVSCTRVSGRPNLSFTGRPITLLPWYFGAIILAAALELTRIQFLDTAVLLIQIALYWLAIRWFVANLASNGEPLRLTFSGSYWAYLGWNILLVLSAITVIGWAWVLTAEIRWICRHIEGTRRAVVFKASGLEYLWRAIVAALASSLIIPIPWVARWMARWKASQVELLDRGAYANS